MATINCPECNSEVDSEAYVCPCCGFPLKKKVDSQPNTQTETKIEIDPEKQKKKKIIGAVMCLVGCVCLMIALTRITNEDYKFYTEYYKECIAGYEKNKDTANSMSGYFKSSYNGIASSYQDMASDASAELWKYRGTAIVCCVLGLGSIFIGYKNIKKGGEA